MFAQWKWVSAIGFPKKFKHPCRVARGFWHLYVTCMPKPHVVWLASKMESCGDQEGPGGGRAGTIATSLHATRRFAKVLRATIRANVGEFSNTSDLGFFFMAWPGWVSLINQRGTECLPNMAIIFLSWTEKGVHISAWMTVQPLMAFVFFAIDIGWFRTES